MSNENWGAYPHLMVRKKVECEEAKKAMQKASVDPVAFAKAVGFNPSPWQADMLQKMSNGEIPMGVRWNKRIPVDFDNPAWPDMSERFTPTMAGLPEPEPQWRSPLFWPVLIVFYVLVIMGICLTMPW